MTQNDEVIWQVIRNGFCSFMAKIQSNIFCRNPYNVTGLCNRVDCPLANSRYATVLEKDGVCYLYMKTIERAHSPKNLWERVKLSKNYSQALKQISQHLEYWPHMLQHKCKQRFTKMKQYLIRTRRLKLQVRKKLISVNTKVERRESTREKKALFRANVDIAIKKEILERLKKGTYDIVNVEREFEDALDTLDETEIPEDEENEEDEEGVVETVEEPDEFVAAEDLEDLEDYGPDYVVEEEEEEEKVSHKRAQVAKQTVPSKKPKVNIEYEKEVEDKELEEW